MAAATDGMSRRDLEDQQRREHVLVTAERLFAHQGFNNTSVSQIAKEAEFGVGTLYKYFKDKAAILQELFRFRLEEEKLLFAPLFWPKEPRRPIQIINDVMMYKVDQISRQRTFFMVYFTYVQPQLISPDFKGIEGFDELPELHDKIHARAEELLSQAIEQGEMTPVNPQHYLAAVHGIVVSFFYMCVFHYGLDGEWPMEELKKSLQTILYEKTLLKPIPAE